MSISKTKRQKVDDELDKAIARGLRRTLGHFSHYWDRAKVSPARWRSDRLILSIELHFNLPSPDDDDQDWLASSTEKQKFRDGLRNHFQRAETASSIRNLLRHNYESFVREYLRVRRFGRGVEQQLSLTPRKKPSGRPPQRLHSSDLTYIQEEFRKILATLRPIKKLVRKWKRERPAGTDEYLKGKIREHVPRERAEWARFIVPCFKRLKFKHRENEKYSDKELADPKSWSAADWAVLVAQDFFYFKTGFTVSASSLRGCHALQRTARRKKVPHLIPTERLRVPT
jgi:hypothetical protein